MNAQGIDEIDSLLKEYELQEREAYINKTDTVIERLTRIAYHLADAHETEYRANPTYENEERMRYWRCIGSKHAWSKRHYNTYAFTELYAYEQHKNEYDELVQRHAKASEYVDEKRHENQDARDNKNIPMIIGLLGLTIGINVLVHILFALAS